MGMFTVENQDGFTYLVYVIKAEDQVDELTLGMIVNNKMSGMVPVLMNQIDDSRTLKYNVTNLVPLQQYFTGVVNRYRFLTVLKGITDTIINADNYMIESKNFVLDASMIYVNPEDNAVSLVCFPVEAGARMNEKQFLQSVMTNPSMVYDQNEDLNYAYEIMNFINNPETFSFREFRKLIVGLTPPATEQPEYQKEQLEREQKRQRMQNVIEKNLEGVSAVTSKVMTTVEKKLDDNKLADAIKVEKDAGFAIPGGGTFAVPGKSKPAKEKPVKEKAAKEKPAKEPKEKKGFSLFGGNEEKKAAKAAEKEAKRLQKEAEKEAKKQKKGGFQVPVGGENGDPGVISTPVNPFGGQGNGFNIPGQQPINQFGGQPANQFGGQPQQMDQFGGQAQNVNLFGGQPVNNGQMPEFKPIQEFNANAPQPVPPIQPVTPIQPVETNPIKQIERPVAPAQEEAPVVTMGALNQELQLDMEETVLVDDETVLMVDPKPVVRPTLTRCKNNEEVVINEDNFVIGHRKASSHYYIGDNPHISRAHAVIVHRDGRYYIVDTNSKNHTYLDGYELQPMMEYELQSNMVIRLANEDFLYFKAED